MRALLINPWVYDFSCYDLWSKPLGLLTIAAHLKRANCEVDFIDCLDRFNPALEEFLMKPAKTTLYGDGQYHSESIDEQKPLLFKNLPRKYKRYGYPLKLFKQILDKKQKPDIILVTSAMSYWYPAYFDMIRILKEQFPGVPVVLGGIYAILCFEHAQNNSNADFVYKGSDVLEIMGLISNLGKKKINYQNLADRIYPAYELYPVLRYITLRTSRGCPFKCTYCGWYALDKEFKQEPSDFIIDQIAYYNKKYKINNFSFYDDALLYNADTHIVKILQELIRRNVNVNFHTPNGMHNRFITPQIARLLKKSNFLYPRLAFETSSPKRQKETGGKTSNKQFLEALKNLKNAGFYSEDISAYILIGLPGQTQEEIKESIEFAHAQKIRIFLEEYSPVPGTPDYKKGNFPPDADPLLHNNSAFPIYNIAKYHEFQEVKDLVHRHNNSL